MRQPVSTLCRHVARFLPPLVIALLLGACGTVGSLGGGDDGGSASSGLASFMNPTDPLDRPTRVGQVSAQAKRCGFVFQPAQLRASYFSYEQSLGQDPRQIAKLQNAYDYSFEAVSEIANEDKDYCTRDKVDEIRANLNQYLSGNFQTP
ncbi:MAG: hypothetical protein AAF405_01370 [Pseudomonadota bacterium]